MGHRKKGVFLFLLLCFLFLSQNSNAQSCHTYTQSSQFEYAPTFATPSNTEGDIVFTAECSDSSTQITIESPSTQYYLVYKYGFYLKNNQWQQIEFQGTPYQGSNWIDAKATASLELDPTVVLFYGCEYKNNRWYCGCVDNSCSKSFWQLQKIEPPPPDNNNGAPISTLPAPEPSDFISKTWNMAGANIHRTSWVDDNFVKPQGISWYRPIEAYIDQKTQIVGGSKYNHIYVATTKGLLAFDAISGNLAWRMNTEMPLGHTPTVIGDRIYIGGYDRKLHAIDDLGSSYALAWSFDGAQAGFSTSPVVVSDSHTNNKVRIYATNRDGYLYALEDQGSSASLVWKYPNENTPRSSLESIQFSPAYSEGIVYIAAQNMHAYAIKSDGSLDWRSDKLPGMGFISWWPVIYDRYVVLGASGGYSDQAQPGARSVTCNGNPENDLTNYIIKNEFYGTCAVRPSGDGKTGRILSGGGNTGWPSDFDLIDSQTKSSGAHSLQSYADSNSRDRKFAILLNKETGKSAGNLPFTYVGTKAGNMYPALVNPHTNALYMGNMYSYQYIPRAALMGWKPGNRYLHVMWQSFASDEPIAFAGIGTGISRSLCCDRLASVLGSRPWSYDKTLDGYLPAQGAHNSYDSMWGFWSEALDRLSGYYKGDTNSHSGVYHNHGNQNPIIPFKVGDTDMYFTHRSNAIIAMSSKDASKSYKSLVKIENPVLRGETLSKQELQRMLEYELDKVLDLHEQTGGFPNPGYINLRSQRFKSNEYFKDPALLLETVSRAYFVIDDPALKQRTKRFADAIYNEYFAPHSGSQRNFKWQQGFPREAIQYPREVQNDMNSLTYNVRLHQYYFFYDALYHYARIDPNNAPSIYNHHRSHLNLDNLGNHHQQSIWRFNQEIKGLEGFLKLQTLAKSKGSITESPSSSQVQSKLNQLRSKRVNEFQTEHNIKGDDNPGGQTGKAYDRIMNLARNFMYVTKDSGNQYSSNSKINSAVDLYTYLGPYWFVMNNDNGYMENVMHHLWDTHALFRAKAYVKKDSQAELSKYIDVPAFPVADLIYMDTLIIALEQN